MIGGAVLLAGVVLLRGGASAPPRRAPASEHARASAPPPVVTPLTEPVAAKPVLLLEVARELPSVEVEVSSAERRFRERRTLAPVNGRASIEGLAPGSYALDVRAAGRARWHGAATVGPGVTIVSVLQGDGRIEGTVLARGQAVARARVRVLERVASPSSWTGEPEAELETDAEGRFAVDGLAAGVHCLLVETPATAPLSRAVRVGGEPSRVTLELDSGSTLAVRAIPGAWVLVESLPRTAWTRQALADERGFARVENVPAGRVRIAAFSDSERVVHDLDVSSDVEVAIAFGVTKDLR